MNKAQISRFSDALGVLGLRDKPYELWSQADIDLYGELTELQAKHAEVGKAMVFKSEQPQVTFELGVAKALVSPGDAQFYQGPRTAELDCGYNYSIPASCRSIARKSLGLAEDSPERRMMKAQHTRYSPALVARPWLL